MTGRRPSLAAGSLLVLAALLPSKPAEAQLGAFIDGLLGRQEQPAPAPEAPATTAPAAPKKPPAPAVKPQKDARPATTPEKPAAAKSAAKPTDAPPKAGAASPAGETDPATLLAQANAYFNGITTLTGSFIQIGADGRRIGGKLTLSKPGRLRFDYDQPSPLEVVADGTSVRSATASSGRRTSTSSRRRR